MGEAKRKKEAAQAARDRRDEWLKKNRFVILLASWTGSILLFIALAVVIVDYHEGKMQVAVDELRKKVEKGTPSVPGSSVRTTVVNTPEGFAQLAQSCEKAHQWGEAKTYWKAVLGMGSNAGDAQRGYARACVMKLRLQYKQQPAKQVSSYLAQEAYDAASGLYQQNFQDPFANELMAYACAFMGKQADALMHAGNAAALARRHGMIKDESSLMTEVIAISSRHQGFRNGFPR